MLAEVTAEHKIGMVDIYGGEISLVGESYWNDLIATLQLYGIEDINLVTNLSAVNQITTDPRVYTSVSYDFEAREDHERVWRNMALLQKPFSILMLASPKLISQDIDMMVAMLNSLSHLESVEIKPYSSNQANQLSINYADYERFVQQFIEHEAREFSLVNEYQIRDVLDKVRNSFSDDHIYITPNGRYGVLEFDLNDNEFFLELDTMQEYQEWCEKEKHRVSKNKYCSNCEYYGHCLSEHLREVKNLDQSCNGFKHLIDWYKNGRLES